MLAYTLAKRASYELIGSESFGTEMNESQLTQHLPHWRIDPPRHPCPPVECEASVAELATPFEMTPRAVSKHVGVPGRLARLRSRDAQRRPSCIRVAAPDIDQLLDQYCVLERPLDKLDAGQRQGN
jgi:hypothetical protein